MKIKFLLLSAVLTTCFISINAQKKLVHEEFSSPEWQEELLRLNPTYVAPTPTNVLNNSATFSGLNNVELYFNKYKLDGDITSNRVSAPQVTNCARGGDHNVLVSDATYVPLGFRFRNAPTGIVEFPELTSADSIILHLRNGNNTDNTSIYLEEWSNETWNLIHTFTALGRSNFWESSVDQIAMHNINSRNPIKLRLRGASTRYTIMFEMEIQEHYAAGLKQAIDSATTIYNANAENIGTGPGQFPQSAYDNLATGIANATTVFNNNATTPTEVENARLLMNTAINDFNTSKLTGTSNLQSVSIKQYGRKLVTSEATLILIYNMDGTLLHQQDQVQVMILPAHIGQGIYLIKSKYGIQKMYFNE